MKKVLSILFVSLIVVLITGCSKTDKLVCTKTSNGVTTEETMIFEDGYMIEHTLIMKSTYDTVEEATNAIDEYRNEVAFKNYDIKQDGQNIILTRDFSDTTPVKADKKEKKQSLENEEMNCEFIK